MSDPPTARDMLKYGCYGVRITCAACDHTAFADLPALVAAGRGDVPLIHLRFRCATCGSTKTFSNVTYVGAVGISEDPINGS